MIIPTSLTKRGRLLCAATIVSAILCAHGSQTNQATDAPAAKNQIEIKDFHFNPETLTVKPGEKITWINHDEEPHTVASVGARFKKSPPLDTDQTFTITADAPGKYEYFCTVHPKMIGTIVVQSP